MSKPAHTPGPWVVGVKGRVLDQRQGSEIAYCPNHACFVDVEANLRLIAAAPALLEALQALMSTIPYQDETNFEAVNAGLKAIASATGGKDDQ